MTRTHQGEIKPGDVLDGKYEILRRIGAGGMGSVYAAKRVALDDTVAVKCIQTAHNNEDNRARFLREAKAAARIRHPNVVQVFDFGDSDPHPPYMVMEFLEGPTLAEELVAKRMAPERALSLFGEVCAAIEAGHRRGVVHRDLKPGNVILARSDDGRETVKVLDFGLARLTDSTSMALTSPGALLGTCSYMAPEQIEGSTGDTASDIFSLGVMLYELLLGRLPFEGKTQIQAMLRIAEGRFTPPREVDPELSDAVVEAIEAALNADPSARPSSPEALASLAGCQNARAAAAVSRSRGKSREAGEETVLSGSSGISMEKGPDATIVSELRKELLAGAHATPDDEAFVGRAAEVEALREELEACKRGSPRITIIDGSAGVGKTRLMERFLESAEARGAAVFRGRFFSYEGDRPPPYETFSWMLTNTGGSSVSRSRPAGLSPGAAPKLDLGDDRWQAFASLADAFVDRAIGRTVILALDDIQWATALDLEFLTYAQRGRPVMVVATARNDTTRPDARTDLSRWLVKLSNQRVLTRIGIEPFTSSEIRAWLTATLGSVRIKPADLRRLAQATGGNPYYLSEVVRKLVGDGTLSRKPDGWTCAPLDQVELPESVSNVVRAKLQNTSEEVRKVLEIACVVGEEFRFETLEHAAGMNEDQLEELLEEATRLGLLSEKDLAPGSDYRFDTPTIRSVLYADLSKRKRKRSHKKVVETLQELYGSDRERIAKVLCYHHHAVGDWQQTLEWGLVATEHLARDDVDNALASVERARSAASEIEFAGENLDRRDRARLDYLAGELYDRIGRIEEGSELLERAAADAQTLGDDDLLLDVLNALGDCRLGLGQLEQAVETGRRACGLAAKLLAEHPGEEDEDGEYLRRELNARTHAARYYSFSNRYQEGVDVLEPVVELQDEPGMELIASKALRELAYIEIRRGQFKESGAHARAAKALARRCGDIRAEYNAMATHAAHLCESGNIDAALPALEEALEMARRLSLRRREGIELLNLGEAHFMVGNLEHGLDRALEALAILTEIEDRATEGGCRVIIGQLLLAKGESEEGVRMLQRGRDLCRETGRVEYACLAEIEIGKAHAHNDDPDRGLEILSKVRDELENLGSLYLWQAELALAKVRKVHGEVKDALACARKAATLLESQRGALGSDSSGLDKHVAEVSQLVAELRG